MQLNKVFEPGKIGNLEIKNKLIVSAMSSHLGNADGTPNKEVNAYLEAKALGGWGLIFTEDLGVTEDAGSDPIVGSLWNDSQIPAWSETVRIVHNAGGLMGAQIYHAGRQRKLTAFKTHPVAPSAIKEPAVPYVPRELEISEIKDLVKAFGEAALRVKKCGFDCVEIHGAHGYLINQFMSPFSNKRTDEYGGTLHNRMRFPLEVIKEVRSKVGDDYPIVFRFNTQDYVEGGIDIQEGIVMAKILEEAGIDALHCTQGMFASKETIIGPGFTPVMAFIENAAAIKKAVQIPTLAVGRINDVYMAESILRDSKADFVVMARASLADPELPNKAKAGKIDDIIHCIGCNQGCTGETAKGNRVNCLANPHTCRETKYNTAKVDKPKKVFVAGAGVSGLSAAIGAAEKGHQVTIFESKNEIGGQWLAAAASPGKTEYNSLIWSYRQKIKKYNVEVLLNSPLTKDIIDVEKPDAVIIATGSNPMVLPIPGLDNTEFVKSVSEVLRCQVPFGKNVVVIGGGLAGTETAVFLSVQGCKVTIVEMAPEIISEAVAQPKACLMHHIQKYNINVSTNTKLTKIEQGAVFAEKFGKQIEFNNVDMVVNAMGVRSNNTLKDQLTEYEGVVISTGDALKAKDGYTNIRESFDIGNSI